MQFFKKKGVLTAGAGLAIGIINGLLGAGGGMIAVPLLQKLGLDRKQAHANAVAVILPITVLSAVLYLVNGYVSVKDSLIFIPGGIAGSLLGTFIMRKISSVWLKRIFGGFMIYAGLLAGLLSGIIGAMGLGGGAVLIIYLSVFTDMPQLKSQGINLLFFIPIAIAAVAVYGFKKQIKWKLVAKIAAWGLVGTAGGLLFTNLLGGDITAKIFGGMLIIIGISEIGLFGKKEK